MQYLYQLSAFIARRLSARMIALLCSGLMAFSAYAQRPDWRFNPADFEHSMSLTVAVHYSNRFSADPEDLIAAFHGNELRGVARVQQVPSLSRGLAFLLIKSNRVTGDTLTFRVYSAAERRVFSAFNRTVFVGNGIVGNPSEPFTVAESGAPLQIVFSNAFILSQQPVGVSLGTFSTEDVLGTSHIYELAEGPGSQENFLFGIQGSTLVSRLPVSQQTYPQVRIRVRSRNNLGIAIERVFELPVETGESNLGLSLSASSVAEGLPVGALVGTLSVAGQPANSPFVYELVSGTGSADNSSFRIESNRLLTNEVFRFAQKNLYTVRVRATGPGGLRQERAFEIAILRAGTRFNVLLSSERINENVPIGTEVGALSLSDPSQSAGAVFRVIGADAASFAVAGTRLLITESPDFERKNRYEIIVEALTLTGLTERQPFSILVNDLNEAPTDLVLNPSAVDENRPSGAIVGFVSGTDPDAGDQLTFSLAANQPDHAFFLLRGTELLTNAVFDFEQRNRYTLRIRATDRGGLSLEREVIVQINDVNEAPRLLENEFEVEESAPAGTPIGQVRAADPDAGQTAQLRFELIRRPGETRQNSPFSVSETGALTVNNPAALDFEASPVIVAEVRVTDPGGLSATGFITVSLIDVFEFDAAELPANNLVSPNGDGKNDTFEIRSLSSFAGFRLTIFNAAGQVVFRSDSYRNDWDGTFEGRPLPTGVFYYLFENPATGVVYKGPLSLIR